MEENQSSKQRLPSKILWVTAAVLLAAVFLMCLCLELENDSGYPVYISEIVASNTIYPNADGICCDYIELYNSADYPVDLTGFRLGDLAGSGRYDIPAGTVIPAEGCYVIDCDKERKEQGYAPFGISRSGGEMFALIGENGAILDQVETIASDLNEAQLRTADFQLQLGEPTPGSMGGGTYSQAGNIYNPEVSSVRITEISAADNGYAPEAGLLCDWVELHNTGDAPVELAGYTLSDNTGNDKYVFLENTTIEAGAYLTVWCSSADGAAGVAPFSIRGEGEEAITLKDSQGRIAALVATMPMETGSMQLQEDGNWVHTEMPSPGYANTADGYDAFLTAVGAQPGVVVISEVMSAQQYILPDGNGEFSDWAELWNTSDCAVNLAGWCLTDDTAQLDKWILPNVTIGAGERLVIFCGGRSAEGELHADFSLSASGEALVLSSYLGVPVDAVTFGSAEVGNSFVFEEGVCTESQYPTPGYTNDESGYEAFCAADVPAGPLAIWEVMTANTEYLPQELGNCYDWVELQNISGETIQLSDYSLTDDPDSPGMYQLADRKLAPGESAVVILSGDTALSTEFYEHAGFALDGREDQLLLYYQGTLTDHVYLRDIPIGCSYGRQEGAGGFYYQTPTPKSPNAEGQRMVSAVPVSDTAEGVYIGSDTYEIALEAAGTIFYTTDGSDPTEESMIYGGPLQFSQTTVLRAAALEDGKRISESYTATFLVEEPHSIPVVSLVTDPGNLWGSNGIYKNFTEIKEERRSANLSYSGEDGSFSIDCEISLHGATTVTAFSKKSFTLRFKDSYDGPLHFSLFENSDVDMFSSLILRASHESSVSTHMHDALMGEIAAANCSTLMSQRHKYAALYINGEYWGLYALREHHSPEHYASYMNLPAENVTMVRYAREDLSSTLYALLEFCKGNDMSVPENYAYACSLMDMTSLADWIILETYVCNFDINGNIRYFMSETDGLWRYGLVDLDLGMFDDRGLGQVTYAYYDSAILYNLIENDEFRLLLANRVAELAAGPLSDDAMFAAIDSLAAEIESEIPRESARWGGDLYTWQCMVDDMRRYCTGRADVLIENFSDVLSLTYQEQQEIFGPLIAG